MAVYLVQHGKCLSKEEDPLRPLSKEGRREVELMAAHLRKVGVIIKRVCHSGKTRAEETAEIFCQCVGDGNLEGVPGMAPNDDVKPFAETLDTNGTMYVGHLPHMGKLVSYLTAGSEEAEVVQFKNGGVVCLEKDDRGYHIAWYLNPPMIGG